jgi:V8-like Glu-specific endopeptidase
MEYFKVQSGTGFFVNRDYLVTNAHVVRECKNVVINGAVPEQEAEVVVLDEEHDMALIKSKAEVSNFAPLRIDINTMKAGDNVIIVGYPGEKGASGEVTVSQAIVKKLEMNDVGNPWQFYISDAVQHGNSGGPALDSSGNVIGMVMGMMELKTMNMVSNEEISKERLGIVISLRAIQHFLENQGIYVQWGGSNLLTYAGDIIEENARRYIVNVQCRKKTDVKIIQPQEQPQ